jgi:hypothetical protein
MRAKSFVWFLAHLAALLLALLLAACTAENSSTGSGGSADGLPAKSVPGSGSEAIAPATGVAPKQQAPYRKYRTIEWVDLIPEDDLEALLSPPDYLADIVDGSLEDQLPKPGEASLSPDEGNTEDQVAQQIKDAIASASDSRYQQALVSTRIKEEFKDQSIRMPGFIVPLEFDAEQTVTQFFIVPYFGACIHSPPPPPNQTVFATFAQGVDLDLIYDPFWFSGTLTTSITEKETATSAYSLSVDSIEPYSE